VIQLVWTPWKQDLLRLVAGARHSVDVAVAYLEGHVICDLHDAVPDGVRFRLLTRMDGGDIRTFELLDSLRPALDLRVISNLHAKVIVVDQRIAVLGSSNLTEKGLGLNKEAGVLTDEPLLVSEVCGYYDDWWKSAMQIPEGALSNLVPQLSWAARGSLEIERAIARIAVPASQGPSTKVSFDYTVNKSLRTYRQLTIPKSYHEQLKAQGLIPADRVDIVCPDGSRTRGRIRYEPDEKSGEMGAYYQMCIRGHRGDVITQLTDGQEITVEVSAVGEAVQVALRSAQ